MAVLTPIISEVLHANTSLFLSRNYNNSVSSFDVRSSEIITVLSGTLGSSGTLLVSHSGSIDMLTELSSFSFLALFADVLFFLILQIVYISVAWSEALLFVSCIFLAAVDRDNPEDC
jgi:hypothetical protein